MGNGSKCRGHQLPTRWIAVKGRIAMADLPTTAAAGQQRVFERFSIAGLPARRNRRPFVACRHVQLGPRPWRLGGKAWFLPALFGDLAASKSVRTILRVTAPFRPPANLPGRRANKFPACRGAAPVCNVRILHPRHRNAPGSSRQGAHVGQILPAPPRRGRKPCRSTTTHGRP
jgi:hypothetical protein